MGIFKRFSSVLGVLLFTLLLTTAANAQLNIIDEENEDPGIPVSTDQVTLPVFIFGNDPTQGLFEQSLGFYSNGSLISPTQVQNFGNGFTKLFQWRDRGWATFDLTNVIETVAAKSLVQFPYGERLQIGDISQIAGGKSTGHASHQNGLDVDLNYYRTDRKEQDPSHNGFAYDYVSAEGVLSADFDIERNWAFVKDLDDTGRLDRIFTDNLIKKALCGQAAKLGELESRTETLRKLRHWNNHDNHLHVRLTCPMNSPRCVKQVPPAEGSGCL